MIWDMHRDGTCIKTAQTRLLKLEWGDLHHPQISICYPHILRPHSDITDSQLECRDFSVAHIDTK